jgi:hypothetical protein
VWSYTLSRGTNLGGRAFAEVLPPPDELRKLKTAYLLLLTDELIIATISVAVIGSIIQYIHCAAKYVQLVLTEDIRGMMNVCPCLLILSLSL